MNTYLLWIFNALQYIAVDRFGLGFRFILIGKSHRLESCSWA
ncbi:MAG: hypothetical protein UZ08_BCD001001505 [Candidatus Parvibacillus calidus]|nr:MAG: hypothetical protein UZ08_BCD001001505 [Candidatus Parvibacillus calidus]